MFLLTQCLWVAPHLLLLLCLVGIFRRKGQAQLPLFTGYIVFEFVHFLTLFLISLQTPFPKGIYHWILAGGEAISTLWGLGVVYELANRLFFLHPSLARFSRSALRWSLAGLVLFSAMASGTFSDISVHGNLNLIERLDFSSNLILAGMLLALLLMSHVLQVSWRSWITGIALGFGVYACIGLVAAALRAEFGKKALMATDITEMIGLNVCVVIWLIYIFLPERSSLGGLGSRFDKSNLELWNGELEKLTAK